VPTTFEPPATQELHTMAHDSGTLPVSGSLRSWAATIFSFPVMCLFSLFGLIYAMCLKTIAEPDIWWHLRNGRYLEQYHSLPRVDMYSYGAAGSQWLDHEWLSEIPFYLGFKAMGLPGIVLVYFVVITLIFSAVYYRTCRSGSDCKDTTLVTCAATFLASVSIGPRTLLFGWLCMAALLLLLDEFQRSVKGLWLVPPLFALWINLHGSWLLGMVVLAVTIASGLVEGKWGLVTARRWSPLQLKKLLITLACSMGALFVNPFGYRLVVYPFDFLFRQPSNMKKIQEWQSVDFNTPTGRIAMLMICVLLAAALFSRRRWRLDEVIVAAFAVWNGLSHGRLLFFSALILPPILASRVRLFPPYDKQLDKPWLNAFVMAGIVGAMIFFFPSQSQLQNLIDEKYPTNALEFMQRQHLQGKLFNAYHWGGYIEWKAPDFKPFYDGRADIFVHNGTFDEGFLVAGMKEPFEILNKYGIEYVLFETGTPLSYLLDHSAEWKVIYADSLAKLYQRVPSASATGIGSSPLEAQQRAAPYGTARTTAGPISQ